MNIASKCGYTPQYKGLQALYTELAPRASSSSASRATNSAAGAGTADEIKSFCELNYGVTFPLFSKVVKRRGPTGRRSTPGSPVRQPAEVELQQVPVGKDGKVIGFYPSAVKLERRSCARRSRPR